ncbi:hypothetical protein LTR53_007559 [Teratosphaeriaceae sp. CCFEE 6253]|nr:hypothetical protein LTR53_007559 [Teratosphaeriaceae sp. CCFEE 6253]
MPPKRATEFSRGRGRGTVRDSPGALPAGPLTPTVMPAAGTPQHLPPKTTSAIKQRSISPTKTDAATDRSYSMSPIRMAEGSVTGTAKYLSVKYPDMLSAADRVLHHNMAVVADEIGGIKQALVRFASARLTGKGTAVKEHDDPEAAAEDARIEEHLDKIDYQATLRDLFNQYKGVLAGSKEDMTSKKGTPAASQAQRFLDMLGEAASQEQESGETAMVVDQEEVAGLPRSSIYALATAFSDAGRMQWYLQMVKAFGLGPRKANARKPKAQKTASGATKRKIDDAEEEEEEEVDDDDVFVGTAGDAGRGSPKKKARTAGGQGGVGTAVGGDEA